jgi:5-formyltetrahydrofolate cyclo-ligase
MGSFQEILARKKELRRQLRALQSSVPQEWIQAASRLVVSQLKSFPPYRVGNTIMCFVSLPREVHTHDLLREMQREAKNVVIPWCDGAELRLFRFRNFDELVPGTLGILEPAEWFRTASDRVATPEELDLVLVPGLGFDRRGGRLGRGKGYYDRFLKQLPARVPKVALAFEWQLVDEIPMLAHDVRMDWIITEKNIYPCH